MILSLSKSRLLFVAAWHLYPCPACGADLDRPAFGDGASDGSGEPRGEVGAVVGSSGSEDESGPGLPGGGDNAAVHASNLVDAAGHEDAPVVVAAGLDVLLNPRIDVVVVCQCIEIIHHNHSVLRFLLEQLTQIIGP